MVEGLIKDQDYLNKEIFTINDLVSIDLPVSEPNWKFMFFEWIPKLTFDYYIANLKNIYPYNTFYFIQGLMYEYGINYKFNKHKALLLYIKSAELNSYYSLYKLFFIYSSSDMSKEFEVTVDIDFAVYCLCRSLCYIDMVMEINKVDPFINLLPIINRLDRKLMKISQLLKKMENRFILPCNEHDQLFILYFLQIDLSLFLQKA